MNDFTYPAKARLAHNKDIKRLFEQSRRISGSSLNLLVRPNDLGHARLGIIIAKKQVTKAVIRNRIRRVMRESFRHKQADLGANDILLIAKAKAGLLDKQTLWQQIETQWLRLIDL